MAIWKVKKANIFSVKKYTRELKIGELFARVLINRGISLEHARNLIYSPAKLLENPYEIVNANEAADRIVHHIKSGSDIFIFADYDVDGITSGFVVSDFLSTICNNSIYIYYPERTEGYGLNSDFCYNIIDYKNETGRDCLVITVDNGVGAVDEVQLLKENGIETVIIDHHLPKERLPNAVVCDPHISQNSAGKHLCGCTVAFKVMSIVQDKLKLKGLIDNYYYAAAIGTVADVMPSTPENAAIVRLGLMQLNSNNCPKPFAIYKKLAGKNNFTISDIAWELAPKINACGRIESTTIGAKLFFFKEHSSEDEIIETIAQIEQINEQRKQYTKQAEKEIEKLNYDNEYICLFDASKYPPGIAGIIAGKLVNKFNAPAIVVHGEEIAAGSARSIPGLDITQYFEEEVVNGNMLAYGGHSEACGVTVAKNKLHILKNNLSAKLRPAVEQIRASSSVQELIIDHEISIADITIDNLNEISILLYDKSSITEPIFALKNLRVLNIRESKNNKNNLHFKLADNGNNEIGIWLWNFAEEYESMGKPKTIDIAGVLATDFMNSKNATLRVVDVKPSFERG